MYKHANTLRPSTCIVLTLPLCVNEMGGDAWMLQQREVPNATPTINSCVKVRMSVPCRYGKAPSSKGKRFDVSKQAGNERNADEKHGLSWCEVFQQQAAERHLGIGRRRKQQKTNGKCTFNVRHFHCC